MASIATIMTKVNNIKLCRNIFIHELKKKKKEKKMRITNHSQTNREAILNLLVSFHFLGNQTKGMGEKQTQNNPQIRQTTHELPPKQKSTKKKEKERPGERSSWRGKERSGESRSGRFMSTTHTAPGESRSGTGGSGATRKLWSQEVEEIAGQRYRYQAIFSDIFRQKFRYHPKIFCLKPYLHDIK
jgi:hypothetical protein